VRLSWQSGSGVGCGWDEVDVAAGSVGSACVGRMNGVEGAGFAGEQAASISKTQMHTLAVYMVGLFFSPRLKDEIASPKRLAMTFVIVMKAKGEKLFFTRSITIIV
jgi:hypothetical protein